MSGRTETVPPAAPTRRATDRLALVCCLVCVVLGVSCASRRLVLPSDLGSPLPNFSELHAEVTAACRDVRTFTAALGLRGQAGGRRLSGRLIAGFERPGSMRLEATAPFGAPGFILAAQDDRVVLLLPRDDRVVRSRSPGEVLGALTGVSLGPADLQAILTGCVVPSARAIGGRMHANGWASIELEGGSTIYLRRADQWHLRAARRNGWLVDYDAFQGRFPQTIRLRSEGGAVDVDMTATLSQIEANVELDSATFTVVIPESARPLTIEELRQAGPLGEQP